MDFSDVLTLFKGRGRAAIGFAQASCVNFVVDAVKRFVLYPLLESEDIKKASGLIVLV